MKRLMDIFISFLIILLFLPFILLIVFIIIFSIGFPIFFVQDRIGLSGMKFKLIKFKTMNNSTDEDGKLLPDTMRINKVGKLLRSLSLDELPELWNVLKGDMSLVGPRPLLVEYLSLYNKEQSRRHEVRPGITGWAQINGRNTISWEEKFILDVWYVENRSQWLDIKILFQTVKYVIRRQGINQSDNETMPHFIGNNKGVD